MKRLSLVSLVILILLTLSSCGKVSLHHNLTEQEADRILVLMDENGIDAKKEKHEEAQEVTWIVRVNNSDVVQARKLLVDNNLTQRPELGYSGVYKEVGMIPTPDEQRARFLLALKGEIVNALRRIPGVYDVGVVLNVPEEKEIRFEGDAVTAPSASIVVRVGDPSLLENELTEEKIRRFVANSIPGMEAGNVIVIMTSGDGRPTDGDIQLAGPVPPIPTIGDSHTPADKVSDVLLSPIKPKAGNQQLVEIVGLRMEKKSLGQFRFYLIAFLCVLILLSAAFLTTLYRFTQLRSNGSHDEAVTAVPLLEGGDREAELAAPSRPGIGDKNPIGEGETRTMG
jgi:type III secretion system YscJ/HrcJ family lipoprotein